MVRPRQSSVCAMWRTGSPWQSLEEAEQVRSGDSNARLLLLEGCFEPSEYVAAAELGLDVAVQGEAQLDALLAAHVVRRVESCG
jgi:alanine racemase